MTIVSLLHIGGGEGFMINTFLACLRVTIVRLLHTDGMITALLAYLRVTIVRLWHTGWRAKTS